MARSIPLTRGLAAIVSEVDYERLAAFKWRAQPKAATTGGFYAVRTSPVDEQGHRHTIYMHRLLMNAGPESIVDHVNGDGLDNRRENLRIADLSANNANRNGYNPESGFRGVYRAPNRLWRARLWADGRSFSGGYHGTPERAASAYDRLAIEHFGEFATLNFPERKAA